MLGHFPTGVTVVTAVARGEPVGMTVGSFTSLSLEPPLVAFMASKDSDSWLAIRNSGNFCVNVLAHDQTALSGVMASHADDKFAAVTWRPARSSSPIIEGAIAYVDCGLARIHEGGDHCIVVGRVLELDVLDDNAPLVFWKGSYGTFA